MKTLETYIDELTAQGEIAFTTQQAVANLNITIKAVERAVYRLRQKKEIINPAKGFYLILTPEFRKLGCLPPDYFIDVLMQHWQQPYYVGGLSAALYFGAAHQQPQVFQVIVDHYRKNITCGQVTIEFITKKNLSISATQTLKTVTGSMQISTPETTLLDLIIFMKRNGGINQVFTVISELLDMIKPNALTQTIKQNIEVNHLQRLGYLIESAGNLTLADIIYKQLQTKKLYTVRLVPYYPMSGVPRNKKWNIAVNTTVESDLR